MDCSVCCETFKITSPRIITCSNKDCEFKACRSCHQTYLLSKENSAPHCMSCKTGWSQYFTVTQLTRLWFLKTYTPIRNKVLVDTELSRLPESMERASRIKKERDLKAQASLIVKEMVVLGKKIDKMESEIESAEKKILINLIEEKDKKRKELLWEAGQLLLEDANKKTKKNVTFIMSCSFENCKGFLNKEHFCELCNRSTCKDCLVGIEGDSHTCKEDDKATAVEIKKNTKPCPNCGQRIYKISGCDQMFCTLCFTVFGWRSGEIETGNIHNPHYYQMQRQRNNGIVRRDPNDVLCGGVPDFWVFSNVLEYMHELSVKCLKTKEGNEAYIEKLGQINIYYKKKFSSLIQLLNHISGVDLREARWAMRITDPHSRLRVEYLLEDRDKKSFAEIICKQNKVKCKLEEKMHVLELITVVGTEFLRDILEFTRELTDDTKKHLDFSIIQNWIDTVNDKTEHFNKLLEYANEQFQYISVAFNCNMTQIQIPLNPNNGFKITYHNGQYPATLPSPMNTFIENSHLYIGSNKKCRMKDIASH